MEQSFNSTPLTPLHLRDVLAVGYVDGVDSALVTSGVGEHYSLRAILDNEDATLRGFELKRLLKTSVPNWTHLQFAPSNSGQLIRWWRADAFNESFEELQKKLENAAFDEYLVGIADPFTLSGLVTRLITPEVEAVIKAGGRNLEDYFERLFVERTTAR